MSKNDRNSLGFPRNFPRGIPWKRRGISTFHDDSVGVVEWKIIPHVEVNGRFTKTWLKTTPNRSVPKTAKMSIPKLLNVINYLRTGLET
jgi:hypothetical protein